MGTSRQAMVAGTAKPAPPAPIGGAQRFVWGALLAAYIDAAKAVDLDPFTQLRRAQLPTTAADWLELKVAYERLAALLEATSQAAGLPDFTLRVLKALKLSSFGAVGLLAGAQPTLLNALQVLRQHWGAHDDGVRILLQEDAGLATLRLMVVTPSGKEATPRSVL